MPLAFASISRVMRACFFSSFRTLESVAWAVLGRLPCAAPLIKMRRPVVTGVVPAVTAKALRWLERSITR